MSIDTATLSIAVDSRQVNTATDAMDKMADSGSALDGIIGKIIATIGLLKLADLAKDAMLAAARFETMGVVMNVAGNNAGYTASQMSAFEKSLQDTGISLISSRDALTSMATANLDLAKSSALARAAQDVAVVGNINSSEAFQNMVRGIKSGEVEILKTMGLNVQFEAGYKSLGAELHKNASDLTAQEKLQSRMNQVLQEAAKYTGIYEASMGTAGKQLKSMERFIENLEVQIGKSFGDALVEGVARFTTGLKDGGKAMENWEKSGEQGVFAMKLKDDLVALSDVLVSATGWIIKHSDSILVLAGAYAGFKLGGWIVDLGRWVTAQVSAVQAHIAATTAAYNAANAATAAAVAKAGYTYTTHQSNAAQIAEAQTMLVYNGLAISNAVATGAMTEAQAVLVRQEQAVIATELEKAAAIEASNAAQMGASAALGGVSGGLTVLLSLIGAAVAAWLVFRDTTKEASTDASKFMDERIKRADEHLEKMKRFWAALKPGTSASQAEAQSWSALDDPASQKGMENIRNFQAELGKVDAEWQRVTKRMSVSESAVEILEDYKKGQSIEVGLLELAKKRVQAQQNVNDAVAHEQRLVEALNNEHAQSEFKEQAMIGMNAAKTTTTGKSEGVASTEYGLTGYGREIQRLDEEITKLTVSERSAYEMKLKLMDGGAGGDVSKAMKKWDDLQMAKERVDRQKEAADAIKRENDAYASLKTTLDPVTAQAKAYANAVALINAKTTDAELKTLLLKKAYDTMTPSGIKAAEAQKRLVDDVERANASVNFDAMRAEMEAMKARGLNLDLYQLKLQDIQDAELRFRAESGSTWAIIGDTITQNAGTATDAMVSWMNATDGLARTWDSLGDTFRNVISDMLVQMQKAIIQQQLMKPLMSGISAGMGTMGDGGGWSSFATAFTGAWGGGKASGGSVYPGTTYLVGENGPELLHMGSAGSITPNGSLGQSINAPITVIIQTDGTATTKGGESAQNMKALGNLVASKCREVIAIESRPNGLLAR